MWPRLVTAVLGLWMMAASSVIGYGGLARDVDVIGGAITASVALVAVSEVMRPLRWINAVVGAALVFLPWLLAYGRAALVNSTVVGVAVVLLALVRGEIVSQFGGGWRAVLRPGAQRGPDA